MKPNRIDWLIYRLFRWRWSGVLANNDNLYHLFSFYIGSWKKYNDYKYQKDSVIPSHKTIRLAVEDE